MDDSGEKRHYYRRTRDKEVDDAMLDLDRRIGNIESTLKKYTDAIDPSHLREHSEYFDRIRQRSSESREYWRSIGKTVMSSLIIAIISGIGAIFVMGVLAWLQKSQVGTVHGAIGGVVVNQRGRCVRFLRRHWRQAWRPMLIAVASMPSFAILFAVTLNALYPAIHMSSDREVLTPIVCSGEQAKILFPVTRRRQCPSQIHSAWICAESGVHLVGDSVLAGIVGDNKPYVRNITTPVIDYYQYGVEMDYCALRVEIESTCSLIPNTVQLPDVFVTVKKC